MLTQDLADRNMATAPGTFAQISRVIAFLGRSTIALLAVGLIGLAMLNLTAAPAFAEQAFASDLSDKKNRDISLVPGSPEASLTVSTTLSVALPITNDGTRTATNVSVTGIALSGGVLTPPISFPVRLGSIAPGGVPAVVHAGFSGAFVPGGKYLLTVKGTYILEDRDKDRDKDKDKDKYKDRDKDKDWDKDKDKDKDTVAFEVNRFVIAPEEKLQVSPDTLTLLLDQSVTLTAVVENGAQSASLPAGSIVWEAQNVTENRPARISPQGIFSARLPGLYNITAKAGNHIGHATIRVPDGVTRDPKEPTSQVTDVSSLTNLGSAPPALPAPPITSPGWQDNNFRSAFQIQNRRGRDPVRSARQMASLRGSRDGRDTDGGKTGSTGKAPGLVGTGNTYTSAGSGNYLLTVPVLDLPGRRLNLALSLFYNSQLWTRIPKTGGDVDLIFDKYHDWPAPGWSLGFGKVVLMGSNGAAIVDADGTIHPFAGKVNTYASGYTDFVSHTMDGSLCDCAFGVSSAGGVHFIFGSVKYPNGTVVDYGAPGDYTIYPTRITDSNGNFITITYRNNTGPQLETVQDTLGRVINFHYDSQGLLTALTAPDLAGGTRTVVRLHYAKFRLDGAFTGGAMPHVRPESLAGWRIDAVYDPGTSTGYWFADSDSYSSYGMIAKVSQRRGMTQQSASLTDQGSITSGQMTREQSYKYPMSPNPPLHDAPSYTQMKETWAKETWAGMDVPPAITTYVVHMDADPRRIEITEPDGRHIVRLMYNHFSPNGDTQFDDELLYEQDEQDTNDASGKLLRKIETTWKLGDYDSPRISKTQVTDQLGKTVETDYGYDAPTVSTAAKLPTAGVIDGDLWITADTGHGHVWQTNAWTDVGPFEGTNQLWAVTVYDYYRGEEGGPSILRATYTNYETDPAYGKKGRHIFNLPKVVQVAGEGLGSYSVWSRTEYAYDHQPLVNTPGVVSHSDAANPYAARYWVEPYDEKVCEFDPESHTHKCYTVQHPGGWTTDYQQSTDYRGNVTELARYKDAVNRAGKIVESRRYDIDGNLITLASACCEQTSFTYTANTQFAYPEVVTRGAADPTSPVQVTNSFTYDFSAGLPISSTDPNGRTRQAAYEDGSLRLKQFTLPTSASATYEYDDVAMTTTTTIHDELGKVAFQNVSHFNGLGLVQRTESLADGNVWNAVATQYDVLGRVWNQSQPFQLGQPPVWSVISYDLLGRITAVQSADGSQTLMFYDEVTRPTPSSALTSPGETVRVVDPNGRECWYLKDVFGQISEVIEPDPHGNGSFGITGNIESGYFYNYALGLLTGAAKGPATKDGRFQQELLQYDSLSRLTAEYLHEKSATLDDKGVYVGGSGQWSDVFTYDDHSNLTSHTDARGVKAIYDYGDDPLNRLQHVAYDLSGFGDKAIPVLPSPSVTYRYMTTGDVTRVFQVAMRRENDDSWGLHEYGYDPEGRLASKTLSYLGNPQLVLNYKYDSFDRLTQEIYPAEYGTAADTREQIDYIYGTGGVLSDLMIGGVDYASQVVYNPAGQLTSLLVGAPGPQQSSETYAFDPKTGILREQKVQVGTSDPLLYLTYTSFPGGQLSRLIDQLHSEKSRTYDYDALSRLWHAKGGGDPDHPLWSETYDYDGYGNRTSVTATGHTADLSPIPLDGLPAVTYDALTNHVTTQGFAYDKAGNQTHVVRAYGSLLRYQYDAAGHLAVVFDGNDKILEQYAYGADGHRLLKSGGDASIDPTLYYFWDGDKVIAEYTKPSSGQEVWSKSSFYLGKRLLATFAPSPSGKLVYYNHPDRLGTRLITNNTDSTVKEQLTLPFGTLIPGESSGSTNPVFTSYDRSSITGLDYAVNRTYDHEERFTQPNQAGMAAVSLVNPQSMNLYAYSGNDPVNRADPTGLDDLILYKDHPDEPSPEDQPSLGDTRPDAGGETIVVIGKRNSPPSPPPLVDVPETTPGGGGGGEVEKVTRQNPKAPALKVYVPPPPKPPQKSCNWSKALATAIQQAWAYAGVQTLENAAVLSGQGYAVSTTVTSSPLAKLIGASTGWFTSQTLSNAGWKSQMSLYDKLPPVTDVSFFQCPDAGQ